MTNKKQPQASAAAKVIVYGFYADARPRAAWFDEKDAAAARKAAVQLKMQSWDVSSSIAAELLKQIGRGRIEATGNDITNSITRKVYDEILRVAVLTDPSNRLLPKMTDVEKTAVKKLKPSEVREIERQIIDIANERRIGRLATDWKTLKKGDVVLANLELDEGWWEAAVTDIADDMLYLRWRDYPKLAPIVRHRSTVALINPSAN